MSDAIEAPKVAEPTGFGRRQFVASSAALVAGGLAAKFAYDKLARPAAGPADVAIVKATAYDAKLADIVRRGLAEIGFGREQVKGKSVLLKPNLVEPTREAPHINTHPVFVQAVAEVFRRFDAKEVIVAEGQGHCRDSIFVLEQSGLAPMLDEAKLDFIDLNHDEVFTQLNRLGATKLPELHLPKTLRRADLIVSLPKLKTHHWAGATLAMKNFFGVMPGICYGWPKNVLHQAGIPESILDINATVQPHLAIVDGIVGMEGDGPIMGTPKPANVVVLGTNLAAVDATAVRLMGLRPERIPYLNHGLTWHLGPVDEARIRQRAEAIKSLAVKFKFPAHRHFDQFRG